ncbi:unnamed protein product [Mycetohabitans rhizoxinica HKI 454]|uniref:Uncharacterized protein n=1 Tax=Mycetohabitans rhizoxinica (strain DSM 19002 / CIP 109453 / HKI 454) TaxID=882378 RepID=E5AT90_MYCRK|nr:MULTISPECIES: hypothetical protein [Mycetohabitans]MCF7696356.1 hypothetical protein [Mycetohabitans sp. B2]MCG1047689.1 hypothetical protein [Mycetohabitans sp. B6]CBW75764.1 unnamed protein product [Mycetohabitans rhizoxinica HKI 454]
MHISCVLCAAIAMIGAYGFARPATLLLYARHIEQRSAPVAQNVRTLECFFAAPSIAPSSNALLGQATRQAQHGRLSGLNKVGSKLRQIGPSLGKVGSKLSEVGLALGEANADCMAGCPPFLKTNRANWAPRQHRAHCKKTVAYAKNAVAKRTLWPEAEYNKLSGQMCWDAVKYCAFRANIITEDEYDALNARWDLVTPHDSRIRNSDDLKNVPPGHALGFFRIEHFAASSASNVRMDPFHVMLNTGGNKAAGNKNDCVGLGDMFGWEERDLSQLKWYQGAVVAPKGGTLRWILLIKTR